MRTFYKLVYDLFDGEATATGTAGGVGASAAATVTGSASGETAQGDSHSSVTGYTRRDKRTGEQQRIVYGKQDDEPVDDSTISPAAEDTTTHQEDHTPTQAERRKAYDDLIREYKDFYAEDTQKIINKRFAETKNLEAQIERSQPILDMLMTRYGVEDGDLGSLEEAISNDSDYWELVAAEAGFPDVDTYMRYSRMERQNSRMLQAERKREQQQKDMQKIDAWIQEAHELAETTIPGFDFIKETENPRFVGLLNAGIKMQDAYNVLHMDEMQRRKAQETERKVVDNIRAKGMRPTENGASTSGGVIVKNDVSKLTKADRAEIAKRARRGETIKF